MIDSDDILVAPNIFEKAFHDVQSFIPYQPVITLTIQYQLDESYHTWPERTHI